MIDHRDRDATNNKWSNLRVATKAQNAQNSVGRKNKHGLKGVKFNKRRAFFEARITIDRITKYLGSYPTAEEAHAAYKDAARRFFGEFACL